jgi:TonB family protein
MHRTLLIVCGIFITSLSHARVETWRVLYGPRPEYPIHAREQHLSGSGLFALHIRPDGRVERVETAQSIGHRSLDAAAVAAFRQWRFPRHEAPWTLRIPIRYVDGPPRIDEPMKRPTAPGYTKLITLFSRAK